MATIDTYHYPPRPTNATPRRAMPIWEDEGWGAQVKFDGTCGVYSVLDGDVRAMTRHGAASPMKRFDLTPDHKAALIALTKPGTLAVFVGELLHGRVKADHLAKNPIVLHDILHYGSPLIGTTYEARLTMLEELTGDGPTTETHTVINERIWRARTIRENIGDFYDSLYKKRSWFPEYEGVVLKRLNAKLAPCDRDDRNGGWQMKSRFAEDKDGVVRRSF